MEKLGGGLEDQQGVGTRRVEPGWPQTRASAPASGLELRAVNGS